MKVHDIKILDKYYKKVIEGTKRFEIRYNDRNYNVGDILVFHEVENGFYTGNICKASIDYIILSDDFPDGLKSGYVVMSITKL